MIATRMNVLQFENWVGIKHSIPVITVFLVYFVKIINTCIIYYIKSIFKMFVKYHTFIMHEFFSILKQETMWHLSHSIPHVKLSGVTSYF